MKGGHMVKSKKSTKSLHPNKYQYPRYSRYVSTSTPGTVDKYQYPRYCQTPPGSTTAGALENGTWTCEYCSLPVCVSDMQFFLLAFYVYWDPPQEISLTLGRNCLSESQQKVPHPSTTFTYFIAYSYVYIWMRSFVIALRWRVLV